MAKENAYIVEVKDLQVYFDIDKRKFAKKDRKVVRAVDGVSFGIREGEILSLVGESGSGKTTTGKAILDLAPATGGEIFFEGRPLDRSKNGLKAFRKEAQMVFQDPYQSLNPRNRIIDLVAEPLDVNHLVHSPEERLEKVKQALEQAGAGLLRRSICTATLTSFPAANGSVWSSPGRSSWNQSSWWPMSRFLCWMLLCVREY